MRQVSLALQKAHEQGIVHRDIKPENILVTRKVEVKVTDFGLSRFFTPEGPATNLTQSGVTLGTPLYMSPEQVQGHAVDHRSDLYSFGVTCYHLLAGEPPFRGTTAFDVALKHVQEQPRLLADLRPDLPPDLCGMVHKLMAKHPDDRYQSAKDVLRDLLKVRDGLAVPTAALPAVAANGTPSGAGHSTGALSLSQSAVAPAPRAPVRWGLVAGVGLACLLAAGGGAALYLAQNQHADAPTPPANGTHAGPGLPDVKSPDKLNTLRERELIVVLNTEGTKPEDAIKASVELGLLCLKERRFLDATERFEKLKTRAAEWRDPVAARTGNIAARLGVAVVLAQDPKTAEQSHKLFVEIITEQPPKFGGPKGPDRNAATVNWVLLRLPDLSGAVSDALNRVAVNLTKTKLDPPALDALRNHSRVGKKD
jgi:serine/threonine-protein kinase